jgi:uncharacterized protein YxjI
VTENKQPENGWKTFQLRHQLFSLGEDFWIENSQGENVYKADSKAMSLRETFVVADVNDTELATIEAKLLSLQPTMKILRGGKLSATVKKAMALFKQKFSIKVEAGGELEAQGNVLKHEYQITSGGQPVATISKKWFSLDDTYGIAMAPGQDEVLLLCAAICIDEMAATPG